MEGALTYSQCMETLIQGASRNAEKQANDLQGKAGPFEGLVVSVVGRQDTIGVSFGPTQNRPMPIPHPFNGSTSWIRSVPEVNSRMLMQNRFDSQQPEALKTLPSDPTKRTTDYLNQLNIYRTLNPGEHDVASSGFSTLFLGNSGNWDARSGAPIKKQLSYTTLSSEDTAPTHIRNLLNEVVGEMGDEERLGIVKRWKNAIDHFYVQDANQNFQAERYLQMKNPAGAAPIVLLQYTEGQVYDDAGEQILQSSTGIALRSQRLWYSTTDEFLAQEIDENGNYLLTFPSTATIGYQLDISAGNYNLSAIDEEHTLTGDMTISMKGNWQSTVQGTQTVDVTGDWSDSTEGAYTLDVTQDMSLTSQGVALFTGSGEAMLKLANGQVALGTSEVEVVDILCQTLQILSTTTAAGFGAPISTVAQFAQLFGMLTPLKGTF